MNLLVCPSTTVFERVVRVLMKTHHYLPTECTAGGSLLMVHAISKRRVAVFRCPDAASNVNLTDEARESAVGIELMWVFLRLTQPGEKLSAVVLMDVFVVTQPFPGVHVAGLVTNQPDNPPICLSLVPSENMAALLHQYSEPGETVCVVELPLYRSVTDQRLRTVLKECMCVFRTVPIVLVVCGIFHPTMSDTREERVARVSDGINLLVNRVARVTSGIIPIAA